MKKIMLALLLVAVVFIGCGTTSESPQKPAGTVENTTAPAVMSNLPEWVMNPPLAEDALYGIGSAKMATMTNSKTAAEARARRDIAFQINVIVQSMVVDYSQEAGVNDTNQVVNFFESITRQVANTTLVGSKVIKQELMDDGTYWVMIEYSLMAAKDLAVESITNSAAAAENAAFAEFKADQALQLLDHQLSSNPPQSTNTEPGADPKSAPEFN